MPYQLDDIDIRILKLLQEDGRLSGREIGERLHKSANPINVRIRRLEDEGYIRKYAAVLDPKLVGCSVTVMAHIRLRDLNKANLHLFESELLKMPAVLDCFHVTGRYDFILRVVVRDQEAYHAFLMNHLFETIPLAALESTFVMKVAKSDTGLPLDTGKS